MYALWMLSAQLAEFRDSSGCLDRRLADRDPHSVCLGAGLGWAGCRLWQTPTAAIETVRRVGVAVGCLWRHGRSNADDVAVRQADPAPGQTLLLGVGAYAVVVVG
jgi:hypothetical protein